MFSRLYPAKVRGLALSAAREGDRAEEARVNAMAARAKDDLKARGVEFRKDRDPAMLDCSATPSCGRWVKHEFSHPQPGKIGINVVRFEVYKCSRCGAERKWGFVG